MRGYCSGHYERLRRYGDPLAGGPRRAERLEYFFAVVVPYDGDSCLYWPFSRKPDGYAPLKQNGRNSSVHRILCEIYNGPSPTPEHEAAHSCGKGRQGCVAKRHLRWATHQENIDDMVAHGTRPEGERHGRRKLTADQVIQIRQLARSITLKEIASRFDISVANASFIRRGETWRCL